MRKIAIYAHRGASGQALENTWAAFTLAHELGIGIEIDLQLTKDGIAVVFHDERLKRLAAINEEIAGVPYEVLRPIRLSKRFSRFGQHSIPLASEVMDWANDRGIPLNIELKASVAKHPQGVETVSALIENLDHAHVSSFDIGLLGKLKAVLPDAEVAWILKRKSQWQQLPDHGWIDGVHFHKKFHKKRWLEPIADMGLPVRLYGITGKERFLKRLHPVVAGLITDHPSRIIKRFQLD